MAADLKRLKGTFDLAQLNHLSLNSDDTKAALEAAQDAYEAALEAADSDENVRNAGPGIVETKGKPSTTKSEATGAGKKKVADTDENGEGEKKSE